MPNAPVKRSGKSAAKHPRKRGATKRSPKPGAKLISVVIPAYNEEPNLRFIYELLREVFERIDESAEFIFVDDGSTDDSRLVLSQLNGHDPRVRAIFLSRNFGQSAALTAGIEAATGDAIIVMDADGQDPPAMVPALIAKWKQGFEIVGGRRASRPGQPIVKRACAYVWYRVMRALVGWDMPADTGEFRIIDRAVADVFRACPQRHRLVRALTSWPGFRQATVDYEHGHRHAGKTKYTLRSSLRLAITCITGFSLAPLRMAFALGAVIMIGALASCLWIMLFAAGDKTNFMALAIAGLWLLGGAQCLFIGILGEYIGRTYIETQRRPLYVVRDTIGLEKPTVAERE